MKFKNFVKKNAIIITTILFVIIYGLFWYVLLPPLNIHSFGFTIYLGILVAYILFLTLYLCKDKIISKMNNKEVKALTYRNGQFKYVKTTLDKKVTFWNVFGFSFISVLGLICITSLILLISGTKLFRANAYYSQLPIEEDTIENFEEIYSYGDGDVVLPLIDKDLAFKLAEAKLADHGAQFEIDYENFTLMNVNRNGKHELVRVSPLEYSSFFVSLSKMNQGSVGYIEVNVVTKEAKLVKFDEGLKYMPSAMFGYDLKRHIYSKYPGVLFDETNFEIDDEGIPYWVMPTYKPEIGLYGGKKNNAVIVCNAITGELNKYELGEEPHWLDRAYDEEIIEFQATNSLRYKHGFMNVHFGAKDEVLQVSDGYNYFVKDGHTYYVSCITSPSEADQTSVGFLTIDIKTGEAKKYLIPGITEMRAMEIAKQDERVKAQQFEATWPILINYKGVPTYFLVLKNDVQAQKIVFINVHDGALVAMGNSIDEAKEEYNRLLASNGDVSVTELKFSGKVIRTRDLGNTIEFTLSGVDGYFVVDVNLSLDARFLQIGDDINIQVKQYDGYYYVTSIEKNN